jgi:hypothetical protein
MADRTDRLPLSNPLKAEVPPPGLENVRRPAPAGEPESAEPKPQTAQEIAATEQALGLAPQGKPTRVSVRMGVAPRTVEEAWRFSQFISESELVPKGYRKRPADVLVAIQYGMEVGLPPMSALNSIFVTNGRPALYGDGFIAVIMASDKYKDHEECFLVEGVEQSTVTAADLAKDR